jgi:hypothetical protein
MEWGEGGYADDVRRPVAVTFMSTKTHGRLSFPRAPLLKGHFVV